MTAYVARGSSPRRWPFIGVDWEGKRYFKWGRFVIELWETYHLALLRARLVCALLGHKWADHDPGDPEVGPQPDVYCDRCGRSMARSKA